MKLWAAGALASVLAVVACESNVETVDGEEGNGASNPGSGANAPSGQGANGNGGNGGDGGTGGMPSHGDPCFDAAPQGFSFVGDGSCKSWQTGVVCQWFFADTATSEGGLVTCMNGEWTPISCPSVDTFFSCPEDGVVLNACDPLWLDHQCPWYVADAGFSCGGSATCTEDGWISDGVDFFEEVP
ncbi:MAG: hypothetical protein HOV80_15730 [Polyangiaceae bacterium]|nr:hypothetical protein [Polyangiaceae bacterium]